MFKYTKSVLWSVAKRLTLYTGRTFLKVKPREGAFEQFKSPVLNVLKVCHDSFCQSGSSVSLRWVIYCEAFYIHVVFSVSCIPVICLKLVLLLTHLQFVYLFFNLSECILLFFSCTWLLISPSGISELDCVTTKTDTAERSISIGRESLQVFFFFGTRGLGVLPRSTARA